VYTPPRRVPGNPRQWWERLEPDARVFAGCYLLLLPFYLWPLLVTRLLPGLDLPFHLSMVDMLSKGSASPYAPYYQGTPMVAPYATHYLALWLLTLGHVLALTTAHKVIIAVYVAGLPLAAAALLAACGRSRIPALLAFPLAYNLTLHYGFISSALSLPVVLLLLAQVAGLLTAPDGVGRRWATTAAVAGLLFLTHLQNFLYGVCAGGAFVLFCRASWRRRALAAAAFAPALAAFGWWQKHAVSDGVIPGPPQTLRASLAFAWTAVKSSRLGDLGRRTVAADLTDRLNQLPTHALRSFNDLVDVRAARTLLVLVLLYFCVGLGGRALRGGGEEPRGRLGVACWVAFGGALFAYLALPHHLQSFELMTFFPRFAPLAVAMMLPLIPAGLKRFQGELRGLLPLPAVLFGVLYGRQLVTHYRLFAEETEDFVAVLDRAQPGHRALGLVFDRQSRVMRIESIFLGLPSYYAADHPAPGSMVPLWYCGMRHIPCRHTPAFPQLPDPGPWEPTHLQPERAVPFFDYFFVRSPPPGDLFGRHQGSMELLVHRGSWWLWRRRPDAILSPLDRRYDD
jgi:hypothetical protein